MSDQRVTVMGSRREPVQGAVRLRPVDAHESVQATIVLRRRQGAPDETALLGHRIARDRFADTSGADPADLDAVVRFAQTNGLSVANIQAASRTIRLIGPAQAMKAAFNTELNYYDAPSGRYRGRVGGVTVPANIAPIVDAVLGLDNRPIAKPHVRRYAEPEIARGLWPTQVARAYNFPTGVTGKGQTIAIIELGGGYRQPDLDAYFASLNLTPPRVAAVSVNGSANVPGADQDADGEVMLDIEVAGAVAPGARIVAYFAPNTDQGFHDAIVRATHDSLYKPSVISISWGAPEDRWTAQARRVMDQAMQDAAALGITITVASGDDGSSDRLPRGNHVDFPASSPFALACGGTRLELTETGAVQSEVVWNEQDQGGGATGGGVSRTFDRPAYQAHLNIAHHPHGRGVPDVAGNADPQTDIACWSTVLTRSSAARARSPRCGPASSRS